METLRTLSIKLDLTRPGEDHGEKRNTNKGITELQYSNGLELQFSATAQLHGYFSRYIRGDTLHESFLLGLDLIGRQ